MDDDESMPVGLNDKPAGGPQTFFLIDDFCLSPARAGVCSA
ncbi:hypothetical protein EV679_3429 [Kerstersia gyiorum]|jgi:hypothetical protein|uniref:Uncharacterized protein n=1 Tax=Kerstersia gyiorum TaxID=206506 RepID=A0A4Q7M6X0_9BURK|nr:hypothetical protein [Kerstersia gyiorum]MCP1637940.1 hypothetical protein [Kerstersia gyiorum]MCP1672378.1 hypothetical protein [Kerstersia gyiorum]MCP1680459.1 hypothetical protein [Kerstersia gyiorum]MCP1683665.1 hypothetical protein [Kerstersia gyiorum]